MRGDWQPAPPPPKPASAVGIKVAELLAKLREERRGSPMRQAAPPRKFRRRRKGEVSITEYGAAKGLGPRRARKVLREIGLLQIEIEVRDHGDIAAEYLHTVRLTPEAVRHGLGRRLEPRGGSAYDVLTTKGQKWADARLVQPSARKATSPRHAARETIRGLLVQGKTQSEIARLTGLSRQLVSHHTRKLAA